MKKLLRATAFVVIFAFIFNNISRTFTISSEDHEYQFMAGLYEEEENSLDAVYIGSSNVYAFWNPLVAWEEYGIAVHTYASSSQPFMIAKYLLKEARKTQPDAVYIFNTNTVCNDGLGGLADNDVAMHRVLDSMPASLNKIELTNYMANVADFSWSERMEYFFPIIKYHSRWNELDESYYNAELNGFKGADTYDYYFGNVKDVSDKYVTTSKKGEISDELKQSVTDLLDYCDQQKVKAVFVTAPRAEKKKADVAKINAVNAIIESRGYPMLDLIENYEDANLDFTQDYYNRRHTNIHGSIKYTHYLSEYLIENYGFRDKRNDPAYESWNKGFQEYFTLMEPYVMDFELDPNHRNFDLKRTKIKLSHQEYGVEVSWKKVEGADGYAVFRKEDDSQWTMLTKTNELSYIDKGYTEDTLYRYTVVPYSVKGGERYYGDYNYKGKKIEIQ